MFALNRHAASKMCVAIFASLLPTFSLAVLPAQSLEIEAFKPGPLPKSEGVLTRNRRLKQAVLLAKGKIPEPEDVAVDGNGRVYAGSAANGNIYRLSGAITPEAKPEIFARPGGMSLGLKFDAGGNLIVCNTGRGLLSVDKDGHVTELVSEVEGRKLYLIDDLDIAPDGKIYFSEATTEWPGKNTDRAMVLNLLESVPRGSLFVFDPTTKQTKRLLNDLYFANGVAVSKAGDYVLVNETFRYRTRRYWLSGSKAGTSEIFADNLPGLPDGVTTCTNGDYWVSLVFPRNKWMDFAQGHPRLKHFLVYWPRRFWAGYPHHGWVLKLNADGQIVDNLEDPTGHVWSITNAVPWQNSLLLGSLHTKSIAQYKFADK